MDFLPVVELPNPVDAGFGLNPSFSFTLVPKDLLLEEELLRDPQLELLLLLDDLLLPLSLLLPSRCPHTNMKRKE